MPVCTRKPAHILLDELNTLLGVFTGNQLKAIRPVCRFIKSDCKMLHCVFLSRLELVQFEA